MKRHSGGRVGGDHGEASLQAPVDHETPRLSRSICGKWNSEYTKLLHVCKCLCLQVSILSKCKKYTKYTVCSGMLICSVWDVCLWDLWDSQLQSIYVKFHERIHSLVRLRWPPLGSCKLRREDPRCSSFRPSAHDRRLVHRTVPASARIEK